MQSLSSDTIAENADELSRLLTEEGIPPEEGLEDANREPQEPPPPKFETLVPFDQAEETLPPFPEDALPDILWDMATTTAESCEADIALAAVPALVNCSVAIGNTFIVQVKKGFTEPLNLYAVTAANSAERKSSVTKPLNKPLYDFQRAWNEDHAPVIEAWNDAVRILTKRIENLSKEAASSKTKQEDRQRLDDDLKKAREELRDKKEHPEYPLRIAAQDATPEVLGKLLEQNQETLSIISDEGGILETLTGKQYAKETGAVNIEVLLQAYSGSPISIDRITRAGVVINNPCLTINITAQPITVRDLVSSSVFSRRGLTARFLYAFPRKRAGTRTGNGPEPYDVAVEAYTALIKRLLTIRQSYQNEDPQTILFSEAALKLYGPWYQKHEQSLRDLEEDSNLYRWISRIHGHCIRIAGLLHVIEHGVDADAVELQPKTFQRAVRITEYFRAHAVHAFSLNEGVEGGTEGRARYIWNMLTRWHAKTEEMSLTKRDLNRKCEKLTPETMQPALDLLEAWGHISVEEEAQGRGRPKMTIHLNPAALEWYQNRTTSRARKDKPNI